MDGSNSAFLYDVLYSSSRSDDHGSSILFIEDFDNEGLVSKPPVEEIVPEGPPPLTRENVERAYAEGRDEGVRLALADAAQGRAQIECAALQSLEESLATARSSLERVAAQHAAETARLVLAMISAVLPETMARHAPIEISAMVEALLPGLRCEPELRVRAHPDLADLVRERLAERLSHCDTVLSVVADDRLGQGDVEIAWQKGRARRNCIAIWETLEAALEPLKLPTLQEVCSHHGS